MRCISYDVQADAVDSNLRERLAVQTNCNDDRYSDNRTVHKQFGRIQFDARLSAGNGHHSERNDDSCHPHRRGDGIGRRIAHEEPDFRVWAGGIEIKSNSILPRPTANAAIRLNQTASAMALDAAQ